MMKIKLFDETEIEVLAYGGEPSFRVYAETPDDLRTIWSHFTPLNTSRIEVFNDDVKVSDFTDCHLIRMEVSQDAKYEQCYAHFYFTGIQSPYVDPEYEEAYNILMNN